MANGTAMPRGVERRVAPRSSIINTQLVTVDLGFQRGALLLDLSASGIGVQALTSAAIGTATALHFQLPGTFTPVDGVGTVTWTDSSGRVGIRFDELAALSRPHLASWLSRQQRSLVTPGSGHGVAGEDEIARLRRDLLTQKIEADKAFAFVLERTRTLTGATGAAIAVHDADAGAFLCRATSGAAPEVGARLNPTSGLSGECIRTEELVRCDDTETDPRVDSAVCRALELRSAVIVPLKARARLIGVLEVFSSRAHAFQSSDVSLLRDAAELIAEVACGKPVVAIPAPAPMPQPPSPPTVNALPKPAEPVPVTADLEAQLAALLEPVRLTSEMDHVAPSSRRLKVLLAALAMTMLAGSAWAGWHWGRLLAILHPASALAVTTPLPTVVRVQNAADPATPAVLPPNPSAAAPKSAIIKKKVPVLVLAAPRSQAELSAPEPPPAVALPVNDRTAASGLSAVLSATAAPASLEKAPSVSQGVTGGKLLRKREPIYPPAARNLRLSGAVVLAATIDVRGHVTHVTVLSGRPLLAEAAVNAVKGWRYEPFLLNGVPIANEVTIKVNFTPKD